MSITKSQTVRFLFVMFFLLLICLGLLWRLVELNIIDRNFLLKQSQVRILRRITIPSYRGMIMDRLGEPLAISTPVDSVWVNPQLFHPTSTQLDSLAQTLNIPVKQIENTMHFYQTHEFAYLKRRIPPPLADNVKALNIPGVFFQREYRRYYPEGEVAAQVVGITNIDDQGQEGLELVYNRWLSGSQGEKEVLKDRLGHVIADIDLLKRPQQGQDLILSLDHRVQYAAYLALKEAMQDYQADAGSIVVLSAKTGEILAMVNQPSYNPNDNASQHDASVSRNRAVTDTFEPGSVIKSFNIALALLSGKYTPNSIIDTSPGWMVISGYTIKDEHNDGVLNLTQVLQKSSNIGAAKILKSLNAGDYWNLLTRLGFGERTNSGFPGEASGSVVSKADWYPSVLATLAYGYGISVTTLQLAQAYSVFANHGVKKMVSFLKVDQPSSSSQIISSPTADTVLHMLEAVVQAGTGRRAAVEGYRIAGKTGTAYIASGKGYDRHHYMSSFVGIAPVSDPQIIIAVSIRNPKHQHMASDVAAPIFSKVMGAALRILNIPPDALPTNNTHST